MTDVPRYRSRHDIEYRSVSYQNVDPTVNRKPAEDKAGEEKLGSRADMNAAAAALSAPSALRLRVASPRDMMKLAFPPRGYSPPGRPRLLAPSFPGFSRSLGYSPPSAAASGSDGLEAGEEGARGKPWLFVGLGNPGKMYEGTRHNVGFDMVDAIARLEGISINNIRSKALIGRGKMGDVPVMFAKPQTFMNLSGESVASLVAYFKVPLNQVLVIYDDLDLPFASLKMLPKGGHGGHNGMRSIIQHFKGVKDFPRLRIGIGRPPGKMEAKSFVLKPFNKKELEELSFMYVIGMEAMKILVRDGFDKSATFVNSRKSTSIPS